MSKKSAHPPKKPFCTELRRAQIPVTPEVPKLRCSTVRTPCHGYSESAMRIIDHARAVQGLCSLPAKPAQSKPRHPAAHGVAAGCTPPAAVPHPPAPSPAPDVVNVHWGVASASTMASTRAVQAALEAGPLPAPRTGQPDSADLETVVSDAQEPMRPSGLTRDVVRVSSTVRPVRQ